MTLSDQDIPVLYAVKIFYKQEIKRKSLIVLSGSMSYRYPDRKGTLPVTLVMPVTYVKFEQWKPAHHVQ